MAQSKHPVSGLKRAPDAIEHELARPGKRDPKVFMLSFLTSQTCLIANITVKAL